MSGWSLVWVVVTQTPAGLDGIPLEFEVFRLMKKDEEESALRRKCMEKKEGRRKE
jgi:hypothetical protein